MLGARAPVAVLLAILILALAGHALTMAAHRMPAIDVMAESMDGDHDDMGAPLGSAVGSCFAILAAAVALMLGRARTKAPALSFNRLPSGPRFPQPLLTGRPPPRTGTVQRP